MKGSEGAEVAEKAKDAEGEALQREEGELVENGTGGKMTRKTGGDSRRQQATGGNRKRQEGTGGNRKGQEGRTQVNSRGEFFEIEAESYRSRLTSRA